MTPRTAFFAAIAPALALGAGPAPTGDLARIQGTWKAEAGPAGKLAVVLTVEGQSATIRVTTPQGLKVQAEGRLRIDESAKPRVLDWLGFTSGDGEEVPEVLGIYELDGDTLRICSGGPNNGRPREFRPGEGILAGVVVFRRP